MLRQRDGVVPTAEIDIEMPSPANTREEQNESEDEPLTIANEDNAKISDRKSTHWVVASVVCGFLLLTALFVGTIAGKEKKQHQHHPSSFQSPLICWYLVIPRLRPS